MTKRPISQAQAERFQRLAWPQMAVVLRTAQCLVRHHAEAEDLAQETMLKAMRAIDSYTEGTEGTDIKAWLLTILRHTHIDRLRLQKPKPMELSLDETLIESRDDLADNIGEFDEQWTEPEQLMNRFEDEVVIQALRNLSADMRWTLLLVDVEKMEQTDAAKVLNVATGTIKSRVHRARAQLRDHLYRLALQRGWVEEGKAEA